MKLRSTRKSGYRNTGFTLLEILIAMTIVMIGFTGMAVLQAKLTQYKAIAKQRTIAVNLAEQQLETMHSFYTTQNTGADACAMDQTGFEDITTCANGNTVNVGYLQFTTSWTVVDYSQNADGSTDIYTDESNRLRPDLKLVTMTVEWTDGHGNTRAMALNDIIDATSIFNTGRLLARIDSNTPPMVPYDSDDFPGVVEIAIGDEKFKGSTTPEPTILNKGANIVTTWDVITFLQTGNNAYLQRREEFKVVNCICTMDAGTTPAYAPSVWDGETYTLDLEVTKRTGSTSSGERGQPIICDKCCNDHHDAASAEVSFDPFRPAFSGNAGTFNFFGDHAHYKIENGIKLLAVEDDDYIEACRFIRRNGIFRAATDMSQENLDVVEESYPISYNTDYSTSIVNFVSGFADSVNLESYPGTVPSGSYSSDAGGLFINNAGIEKQTQSRGIYVDYMPGDLVKQIQCLKADGEGDYSDYCDTYLDPAWPELMPFYDLNVTALSNWSRGSDAIEVSNDPITEVESSSFSRGLVMLAQDHWDVETYASASVELSNTGLTDTNPIDPDDEVEDTAYIDVDVVIGGTPPANGVLILGDINAGGNKINIETVRVSQSPPALDCSLDDVIVGRDSYKLYICDLSPIPATGTVAFTDYNERSKQGDVLNRKVCPSSSPYDSIQVVDDGVMADRDLLIIGEQTIMTFSNLVLPAIINVVIVDESDNCP